MIQEVVAIIDRSGSMYGKESDTIGGINSTLEQLKKTKDNEIIKFSVKFFDDKEYIKIRSLDIENVRPLSVYDLVPRGQTALLDAIGSTISYFINKKMCNPSSFESCIIYVATDGLENCSKKFSNEDIKNLIKEAKKYSIEVLYLGANQDAIFESSKFGLDESQAMNYSENTENVKAAYRSAANAAKRHRNGNSIGFLLEERNDSVADIN
jgi:uncharacterized protein YegL